MRPLYLTVITNYILEVLKLFDVTGTEINFTAEKAFGAFSRALRTNPFDAAE